MPGLHGNLDARLGAAARGALLHGPPELEIHVAAGLAIGAGAISLAVLSAAGAGEDLAIGSSLSVSG